MVHYVGILDGEADVWGVRIPDVPGCLAGGASPEAALADAVSALRDMAAHLIGNGRPLAPARSVHEIMADPEAEFDVASGESLVMIPLLLDRQRAVKANISLDAGTLEAIDEAAKRSGLTRSAFMASAAIEKIMGTREEAEPSADLEKRARAPKKRPTRVPAKRSAAQRGKSGEQRSPR